jgi:hypothetical protein
MVVLPQEALEAASPEESSAIVSPLIPQHFTHYDPHSCNYQPNATTLFKFMPEDPGAASPGGAGPVAAALVDQWRQQRRQEEKLVERVHKVRA